MKYTYIILYNSAHFRLKLLHPISFARRLEGECYSVSWRPKFLICQYLSVRRSKTPKIFRVRSVERRLHFTPWQTMRPDKNSTYCTSTITQKYVSKLIIVYMYTHFVKKKKKKCTLLLKLNYF